MENYDNLKIDHQLCFPLYACARGLVKKYYPYLKALNLTYTQYIILMVLWEKKQCSAKDLGTTLFLDSGTLTPVLKNMEQKGLLKRCRLSADERVLWVELTAEGEALQKRAVQIPTQLAAEVPLSGEEASTLCQILNRMLRHLTQEKTEVTA